MTSEAGRYSIGLPHSRERQARLTGGRPWVAFTDRYRIETADAPGRVVERATQPSRLTMAERDAIVDSLAEMGAPRAEVEDLLGTARSAFETFTVDDSGRLWVFRDQGAGGLAVDLFDADGLLTATGSTDLVPAPRPVVVGSSLFGVRMNDLDVPSVVRLTFRTDG